MRRQRGERESGGLLHPARAHQAADVDDQGDAAVAEDGGAGDAVEVVAVPADHMVAQEIPATVGEYARRLIG